MNYMSKWMKQQLPCLTHAEAIKGFPGVDSVSGLAKVVRPKVEFSLKTALFVQRKVQVRQLLYNYCGRDFFQFRAEAASD